MRTGPPLVIALFAASLAACAPPSARPSGAETAAAVPDAASIEHRVTAVLVETFGVAREAVTPRARLSEDLGMDELDLIEFVMEIEEEIAVEVPDEALERIRTVGDVIEFLRSLP